MKKKRLLLVLLTLLCFIGGAKAQNELTVYEGTVTNSFVPVYGYYADAYQKSEFVIPAAELTPMSGGTVSKMTFYLQTSAEVAWTGTFQVFLKEVTGTTLSAYSGTEGATIVYEGTLDATGSTMEINFSTNYAYSGGNLLVGIYQTEKGNYKSASFYGATVTGASVQGYNSSSLDAVSANQRNFIPQTTFTYTGGTATYNKPKNLVVSNVGVQTATISWTAPEGDVTGYVYQYKEAEDPDDYWSTEALTTATSVTLTGLTEGTVYNFRVKAKYGSNESSFATVDFHTAFCSEEDQCLITLELTDSYNDGWSGNAIQVVDAETSAVLGTYTLTSGGSGSFTLAVCPGREINFVWVKGNYPDEASWVIKDANDEVITSGTGTTSMATGDVLDTYLVDCPSCFRPTNLTVSEITTTSAKLNWEGTSDSYVLQYRPWTQVGEDQTATATMTTYTYDLSAYSGTGSIAIRHYDVTDLFELLVDDIVVKNAGGETIFSENFESCAGNMPNTFTNMDLDGDGHVWEIASSQNTSVNGNYGIMSASYENYVGALTPDNWLIISGIELGGSISFQARGQDVNYPSENFAVYVSSSSDFVEVSNLTSTTYSVTGLEPNTPYAWQVKGVCSPTDESIWVSSFFKTLDDLKVFTTDGNWNEASNWNPVGIPTINEKVRIDADVIIPADVLAVAKKATLGENGSITIQDGGQLKQGSASLSITMTKNLTGYGDNEGIYNFIASPFTGTTQLSYNATWSHVLNLTEGDYDLYGFDSTESLEWINYKVGDTQAAFTAGNNHGLRFYDGYLSANKDDQVLEFTGTVPSSLNNVSTVDVTFDDTSTDEFNGWKLIGNPFTCNGYVYYVDGSDNLLSATFYKMNAAGDGYDVYEDAIMLAPGEGAFIKVSASGTIKYSSEDLALATIADPVGTATLPDLPIHGLETNQDANEKVAITMNEHGIMTYASPYQLDFSDVDGLKAYAATDVSASGDLTMTAVNISPAATEVITPTAGLLLKGDAGTYNIPISTVANIADDLTYNHLVGITASTAVSPTDYVYILANGSQGINWYPLDPTDNTIGANKAYLQLTATEDAAIGGDGARGLGMIFDDGTSTAINLISNGAQNNENGMWYTLQGLRLDKKPTTKGVYIHNGKKVVIK